MNKLFNQKSLYHLKTKRLPQESKMMLSILNGMPFSRAFTLSEVLITLVIIGVVAAITVPMLLNNTNDKQWNVARQKAKATIGEAFRLMTVNGEIDKNKSTEDFAQEILPKYLKIAKQCGNGTDAAKKCGFTDNIKRPDGSTVSMPLTWQTLTTPTIVTTPVSAQYANDVVYGTFNKPAQNDGYFMQTLDGFSLNFFYNPYCVANENEKMAWYDPNHGVQQAMDTVCFNAIYDMNGSKGPNQVGKDIGFVGSFYNSYAVKTEAVLPHKNEVASASITNADSDNYVISSANYCNELDERGAWILPNLDELSLLFLNKTLVRNGNISSAFWARSTFFCSYSKVTCNERLWFNSGARSWEGSNSSVNYVRCVRNTVLK